jgi:hypothetical protein
MSLRRAATALALLALMLVTSVGTGAAQSRGQWRGGGGDGGRRGGPAYSGGARGFTGGGQAYSGGGSRSGYSRGGYGGGYRGGYGGGYGGARYRGGFGYRGGYGYHYRRPRAFIGFSFGAPSYYDPYYYDPYYHARYAHPYDEESDPVIVESHTTVVEPAPAGRADVGESAEIDVTNEPPAGCYYYDRTCDRRFATLDDYTNHLDKQDHEQTVEIIRSSDGKLVRKLVFSGEEWSVAGERVDSQ